LPLYYAIAAEFSPPLFIFIDISLFSFSLSLLPFLFDFHYCLRSPLIITLLLIFDAAAHYYFRHYAADISRHFYVFASLMPMPLRLLRDFAAFAIITPVSLFA
jgi:hypothetical protein